MSSTNHGEPSFRQSVDLMFNRAVRLSRPWEDVL